MDATEHWGCFQNGVVEFQNALSKHLALATWELQKNLKCFSKQIKIFDLRLSKKTIWFIEFLKRFKEFAESSSSLDGKQCRTHLEDQ